MGSATMIMRSASARIANQKGSSQPLPDGPPVRGAGKTHRPVRSIPSRTFRAGPDTRDVPVRCPRLARVLRKPPLTQLTANRVGNQHRSALQPLVQLGLANVARASGLPAISGYGRLTTLTPNSSGFVPGISRDGPGEPFDRRASPRRQLDVSVLPPSPPIVRNGLRRWVLFCRRVGRPAVRVTRIWGRAAAGIADVPFACPHGRTAP